MNPEVPAIRLTGLTKVYKKSHLGRVKISRGIENVSLSVASGEVFGLLGLNGSGKTTTIKLILGLLFPTAGRVEILGRPASDRRAKADIGYLPEVPYFYKSLTGREVLRFYGQLSRVDSRRLPGRIEEVLGTVRMREQASRPMREYSKGMLQRIGLAQAMLHDPRILIFDEPVTGLDPLGMKEMRELILSLNRAGKTVFFSSHSISEAERICHRVGILVKGRLARVLSQAEWSQKGGALEDAFVETVTAAGQVDVG
jgi:ABC-2 type transport system ATP-binding protein